MGQKVPREYALADQPLSFHYINFRLDHSNYRPQLIPQHPPAFSFVAHCFQPPNLLYARQYAAITDQVPQSAPKIDRKRRPALLHAAPSETRGSEDHSRKRIPKPPHRRGARGAVSTQRAHPSRDVSARQAFEFRDPRRNVHLPSTFSPLPRRGMVPPGPRRARISSSSSRISKRRSDPASTISALRASDHNWSTPNSRKKNP